MFGKGDSPELETAEGFVDLAAELRLDAIDFRSDVGFGAEGRGGPQQLLELKLRCHKAGLPIGYLASRGHFTGSEEELRAKIDYVAVDVERAVILGAPAIRVFCGEKPGSTREQKAEVRCLRECCDIAADKGVIVGLAEPSHAAETTSCGCWSRWTGPTSPTYWTRGSGPAAPPTAILPDRRRGTGYTGSWSRPRPTPPTCGRSSSKSTAAGKSGWTTSASSPFWWTTGFNGIMGVVFEGRGVNSCGDREVIARAAAHLRRPAEALSNSFGSR